MKWRNGAIDGVVFRAMARHYDNRGWLAETFRSDEIDTEIMPVMSYVSVTHPGIARGPHEHSEQTDLFAFAGPGNFKLKLWDNRKNSPTHGNTVTTIVGEDNPTAVIVPPGVIHAYKNISVADAWALNFPNRLYAGTERKGPVDEIRHEDKMDVDWDVGGE